MSVSVQPPCPLHLLCIILNEQSWYQSCPNTLPNTSRRRLQCYLLQQNSCQRPPGCKFRASNLEDFKHTVPSAAHDESLCWPAIASPSICIRQLYTQYYRVPRYTPRWWPNLYHPDLEACLKVTNSQAYLLHCCVQGLQVNTWTTSRHSMLLRCT